MPATVDDRDDVVTALGRFGGAGLLAAVLLAAVLLAPGPALAQRVVPPLAPAETTVPPTTEPPKAMEASVSHSALKGLTLKAMSVSTTAVIFALGTGSAATGGLMAVMNGIAGYGIFVANDYIWDTYWPNTNLASNNQNFQATTSLSRNTLKYLTLKPALTVLNVGVIYAFTDTLTATAATSVATIIALPMIFYVNNTLWDWYDWRSAPPEPTASVAAQAK
jgi:uncharacterized membrane protein